MIPKCTCKSKPQVLLEPVARSMVGSKHWLRSTETCTFLWKLMVGSNLASSNSGHGVRFSKVPKLFGCSSGDMIIFVSLKRRRLEARNFAVILIFILFTTYQKTGFKEETSRSFTNGFSGPKCFRDFRETGPRTFYLVLGLQLLFLNN